MRAELRLGPTAAALLLVLPLHVVPAAAAPDREVHRVVGRGSLTRDGQDYRVRLRVTGEQVSIRIRRSRDPDGAGPLLSRQRHTYGFRLRRSPVTQTSDGLRIATGDSLAPWGRVRMEFTPRGPAEPAGRCHRERQRGRLDGVMRLRTHSDFGAVEISRLRAALVTQDSGCGPMVVDPVPRCPPPAWSLRTDYSRDYNSTWAFRFVHRPVAWIGTSRSRSLRMRNAKAAGHVQRVIRTRVDRGNASFAPDLSSAVVKGARGTDVRGRLTFTAHRPLRGAAQWCAFDREMVLRSRRGAITGTMRFDFFIGPDRDFDGRRITARAVQSRNRDIR